MDDIRLLAVTVVLVLSFVVYLIFKYKNKSYGMRNFE